MAELADALVLGTSVSRRGGSSPLIRTKNKMPNGNKISRWAFFFLRKKRTRSLLGQTKCFAFASTLPGWQPTRSSGWLRGRKARRCFAKFALGEFTCSRFESNPYGSTFCVTELRFAGSYPLSHRSHSNYRKHSWDRGHLARMKYQQYYWNNPNLHYDYNYFET